MDLAFRYGVRKTMKETQNQNETIAAAAVPGGAAQTSETIAAIATPLGSGGIGIVRVSGPEATQVLGRLFRGAVEPEAMESHRLYLGDVVNEKG